MKDAPVIAGLLAKRAQIKADVAELEREVRRRQAEVMQIDATILIRPETAPRQAGREPVPAVGALHHRRTHEAVPDRYGRPRGAR
jgi:hypothetical protein